MQNEDQSSLADKDKNDLIYYNNKERFAKVMERTSLVLWVLCLLTDVAYFFIFADVDEMKFQLSDCHLMLACLNFFIPAIIKFAEAWSNSVIHSLFDILQVSDYNKKFNSQINQTNGESQIRQNQKSARKFGRKLQRKEKEDTTRICEKLTKCFKRDTKTQKHDSSEKYGSKSKSKVKPDSFYEKTDFKNRDLSLGNLKKFWQNFLSGIYPGNNIVAQMASVSIFAFIDKEGIVTES